MKPLILATTVALFSLSAAAQYNSELMALRDYATKALPQCMGQTITLEPINRTGPAGFVPYALTQTSTDKTCGRQTFFLFSPATRQVMIGQLFPLPPDARPAGDRIAEVASQALKQPIRVNVAPFPLPDGLHAVTMTKETPYGPFAYHGFLDASGQWMMVGFRGDMRTEPTQSLLESINLSAAVRRGNPQSKVKIVELSDFQCPTCGRAHKKVEPIIAKNLGKVDYYRLDLPLFEHHEWALDAALGARAISRVAPAKYWDYVNFVFANQEQIEERKQPFEATLKEFCEDNEISWAAVDKIVKSQPERNALLDQVSRAFDVGINSTPTYIVNGRVMGFGPEGSYTIEQIRKAIGLPPEPASSKPAAAAKPAAKKPSAKAKSQR